MHMYTHGKRKKPCARRNKIRMTINLPKEIRDYLKENGVNVSRLVENAVKTLISHPSAIIQVNNDGLTLILKKKPK